MSSAAAAYWLEVHEVGEEEEDEADDRSSQEVSRERRAVRRRVQRTKARVGNTIETPKFRKERQQQAELARKGNLSVPLRDQRPLCLVRSHNVDVKDALLGDPDCWKAELDEQRSGDSLDKYQEKVGNRAPAVSDSVAPEAATVPFFSTSLDPEETIDPEILAIFDERQSEVLDAVDLDGFYATTAKPRHIVRRLLMRPSGDCFTFTEA